ncbi:thiamine-phosphate kinase [Lentibacillus halophilus]|uniref:Thiamine-monophosphate kinase n=1 Tax=Lentibacillus halophilus TaxID=295065 RepID=A0ABP3IXK0_9BACI
MDEFAFIERMKQSAYRQSSLVKGVGDDAAVFRQSARDIITTADTLLEGVHFSRTMMNPFYMGYRALAANMSDIAAMGAKPAFYLVSIVIPDSCSDDELNSIYRGMSSAASSQHMDLIGGDTVSGNELSIAITVIGFVAQDKARYRSAARSGDFVFVTGTLGDAAAGFHMLNTPKGYTDRTHYENSHCMPQIRSDFATRLESLNRVALNDISDGIANEVNEIAEASNVGITIYDDWLPTRSSFTQFSMDQQRNWKLYGGEDFELIGTVAEKEWETLKLIAANTNTQLTHIGYAEPSENNGHHVTLIDHADHKTPLLKKGYTHRSSDKNG